MTQVETAKKLASASTDARVREIQQIADQAREKTREMEATPEKIAQKLEPLVESLATISEETKSTLKRVRLAAQNLPAAYAANIKTVSTEAEVAVTQLTKLILEVHEKSLEMASYATQINSYVRRSFWRIAVASGLLVSIIPALLMLGIARANGITPLRLLELAVGI
jgi:hypothetical protein